MGQSSLCFGIADAEIANKCAACGRCKLRCSVCTCVHHLCLTLCATQLAWSHALCAAAAAAAYPLCGDFGANSGCKTPPTISIDVMVALALLYFLSICTILLVKLRALNSLPYDRYQGAIVFYRLQVLYCN